MTKKYSFVEGKSNKLSALENYISKKSAFTLAEVLITLGIIGVVSAMTIPNLITNSQKKETVTKLQKAISVINQAYRSSYDEVGELTPEEASVIGASEYFEKYWAPYLKSSLTCVSYDQCLYNKNKPFKFPNGTLYDLALIGTDNSRATFYTPDGFLYVIFISYNGTTLTSRILVDINGATTPNTFGKDVFYLERIIGENGGAVVPLGANNSNSSINSNCSISKDSFYLKSGGGEYCAEKIRRAGWKIDKSYPW